MFPGPIFLFFLSSFPLLTLFLTFVLSFSPTSAGVPVTTPFLSRRFCFSGCCMYVYWRDLYLLFRFSFISQVYGELLRVRYMITIYLSESGLISSTLPLSTSV